MRSDGMKLGTLIQADGSHPAGWRHPRAVPARVVDFREKARLAQIAEAAKLDFVFFADVLGVQEEDPLALRHVAGTTGLEPITLLSAIAAVTERIGLISTASTSYNEPFHVARKFASLDHISGGRAGWNVVTSTKDLEANNLGRQRHFEHEARYQRAEEFVEIVFGLWNSWETGAFPRDKVSGIYTDTSKMHAVEYEGEHFQVRGLLNLERCPQGRPVVTQAGASEAGRDLAARTADIIFASESDFEQARLYYADIKGRLGAYGRSEDDLKILPGVVAMVAETDEEARAEFQELQDLLNLDVAVSVLGNWVLGGFDLKGYPLDGPLPDIPETNSSQSRQRQTIELARREGLTIRQLAQKIALGRQFWTVIGSAKTVADEFEKRFVQRAADGFVLMPAYLPTGLEKITSLLIPELQRRGLFRTEYPGTTLRDTLGLTEPGGSVNRKATLAGAVA